MSLYQFSRSAGPQRRYGNNHGIALVTVLMFIVVLALMGATAATVTTLSSQISGNYKASIQSLQTAEAGAEEARARLRANATSPIVDAAPTQTTWQAYIGSTTQAQAYGYTGGLQQVQTNSLQTALHYTVVIRHATNASGQILYWGDPTGTGNNTRNTTTGQNIYLVTSYGTAGGANGVVQTQVARVPPVPMTGTVYVDAPTTLQGSSTFITGQDQCGSHHLPGLLTPLPEAQNGNNTVTKNGNPVVQGSPAFYYDWNNGNPMNISGIVNGLKGAADYKYTFSSNTTVTGMSWGTPTAGATQESALSCSVSHTVYYNMGGRSLKLSGGTQGCGILLIDGDLEIHGNFSWYGPVVVTGSIIYTGGGNKNITGALLSGGAVTADVIGGNATILNCSQAIMNSTQNSPLQVLNWKQVNGAL
jgi:Tfp pilus assembly protein PilX